MAIQEISKNYRVKQLKANVLSNTPVRKSDLDQIQLKGKVLDSGTVTAASGAATLNYPSGVVTSESLTTAAAAEYTLTLTNSLITADSIIVASAGLGSSTDGTPGIGGVTPAVGSVVITVTNLHAADAFNGTIKIAFAILG